MAYNSLFPASYQPLYPTYQPAYQTPSMAPQNANNSIIWVSGEAGAKAYLIAPNTTVQLWDSECQRIYLKSADASGMPSMKVLEYTILDNAPKNAVNGPADKPDKSPTFATKDDITALSARITALKAKIDSMQKEEAK